MYYWLRWCLKVFENSQIQAQLNTFTVKKNEKTSFPSIPPLDLDGNPVSQIICGKLIETSVNISTAASRLISPPVSSCLEISLLQKLLICRYYSSIHPGCLGELNGLVRQLLFVMPGVWWGIYLLKYCLWSDFCCKMIVQQIIIFCIT